MLNLLFSFTRVSFNKKTGPIPTTMTSAKSCPSICPFNKGKDGKYRGCYAAYGHVGMHWRKVNKSFLFLLESIKSLPYGQLWRHNVAGDLPGDKKQIDSDCLAELTKANKGKKVICYTHYDVLHNRANRKAIADAVKNGFTINLSANNLAHADSLASLRIAPVATVLPSETKQKTLFTPLGRKVIVCPATYRDNVTCATCRLCSLPSRSVIIGFPAHGIGGKRYVDSVASAPAA